MRRRRLSQPDSQWQRLRWKQIEAVVAVALVLGQLLGALHFGLVRHAICPEDGELGHVGRLDGFDAAALPRANDPITGVNAGSAGWNQGETEHQHCLVQALRRESATRIKVQALACLDLVKDRPVELSSSLQTASADLFRLAPKHSPPA